MKKILLSSILLISLVLIVLPEMVNGQEMLEECTIRRTATMKLSECTGLSVGITASYADYAICCLMDKIYLITDWIFTIFIALAIIFIIYGGFLYMTAGGIAENVERGRNYIKYAIIGFIIAVLAKAIPNIVYYFVK